MFRRLVLIFALCSQFANSADTGLPLYEGMIQLEAKQGVVEKHRLALSKSRKVDGRLQFENEERHSGLLLQTLYQIDTEDTLEDVAGFYRNWIADAGLEVLFTCVARLCGSSNDWANGVFHQKLLYGADDRQYYWVIRHLDVYWVVYLVERGNKRIYLYFERMQPHAERALNKWHLPAKCLIGNDFAKSNPAISDGLASEYLLVVSIAGTDTIRAANEMAQSCAGRLRKAFPGIHLDFIGLGEYASSLDRKVRSDQFILLRLDS